MCERCDKKQILYNKIKTSMESYAREFDLSVQDMFEVADSLCTSISDYIAQNLHAPVCKNEMVDPNNPIVQESFDEMIYRVDKKERTH
jgi:hypothetical protein